MNLQKAEEFLQKHAAIALGIVLGVIILFLYLRNKQSTTTQTKATTDTLHKDLQQIDFDVNQLDTNFSTQNSWTSNVGIPSTQPVTPITQQGTPVSNVPGNVLTGADVTALTELYSELGQLNNPSGQANAQVAHDLANAPVGSLITPAQQTQIAEDLSYAQNGFIPALSSSNTAALTSITGYNPTGTGPYDLPEPFFNDEYHQLESYGLSGDYNDYASVN